MSLAIFSGSSLPKFNGNPEDYWWWFGLIKKNVLDAQDLTPADKFYRLLAVLDDETRKSLVEFNPVEPDMDGVVKIIESKFNDPLVGQARMIQLVRDFKPVREAHWVSEWERLLSLVQKLVVLKRHGDQMFERNLVERLVHKLPATRLVESNDENNLSLENYMENINASLKVCRTKLVSDFFADPLASNEAKGGQESHANGYVSHCTHCNSTEHRIMECPASDRELFVKAKDANRCLNCLRARKSPYHFNHCRGRCVTCNGFHHSRIHAPFIEDAAAHGGNREGRSFRGRRFTRTGNGGDKHNKKENGGGEAKDKETDGDTTGEEHANESTDKTDGGGGGDSADDAGQQQVKDKDDGGGGASKKEKKEKEAKSGDIATVIADAAGDSIVTSEPVEQ